MARLARALDDEIGRGGVGGQGASGTEVGDALFDQGLELGFHYTVAQRFGRIV